MGCLDHAGSRGETGNGDGGRALVACCGAITKTGIGNPPAYVLASQAELCPILFESK